MNREIETLGTEEIQCPLVDAQHCGIHFNLDIIDSTLEIKWQFSQVALDQRFYSRHVLMVQCDDLEELEVLVEAYYKYLTLGSFLKVIDLTSGQHYGWFQKTSSKVSLKSGDYECQGKGPEDTHVLYVLQSEQRRSKNIAKHNSKAMKTMRDGFKQCLKYIQLFSQFLQVTILVTTTQDTIELIHDFSLKLTGHVSLLARDNIDIPVKLLGACLIRKFRLIEDAKELFQDVFMTLTKFRIKKVGIDVQFLNVGVRMTQHEESKWRVIDGKLHRQLVCLDNYTYYIEKLNIINVKEPQLGCRIVFRVVKLDGSQFVAQGDFKLNLDSSRQKSAMKPRTKINDNFIKISHRVYREGMSDFVHKHQEQVMINYY